MVDCAGDGAVWRHSSWIRSVEHQYTSAIGLNQGFYEFNEAVPKWRRTVMEGEPVLPLVVIGPAAAQARTASRLVHKHLCSSKHFYSINGSASINGTCAAAGWPTISASRAGTVVDFARYECDLLDRVQGNRCRQVVVGVGAVFSDACVQAVSAMRQFTIKPCGHLATASN